MWSLRRSAFLAHQPLIRQLHKHIIPPGNATNKPIIRVPLPVMNAALKRHEKNRKEGKHLTQGRLSEPIIRCRRPELNHYKGQSYPRYKVLPLASEHWASRRSKGDFFEICGQQSRHHFSVDNSLSFKEDFELDERLSQSLVSQGYVYPTAIQREAIPKVIAGGNSLIASETGNGKTLAFLIPAIQQILQMKAKLSEKERLFNAPLGVVATPGRELAMQIAQVAKLLCQPLDVTVRLHLGNSLSHKIASGSCEVVDLVIGSFGALNKMFHNECLSSRHIQHLVLDEADTLLDDTFNQDTTDLIRNINKNHVLRACQLTLVGATMPTSLEAILKDTVDLENLEKITTPLLHHVLPHVRQEFIRASPGSKHFLMMDAIEKDLNKNKGILVFANTTDSADAAFKFLRSKGVNVARFHSGLTLVERRDQLGAFLEGEVQVLCSTDLLSRGIDTSQVFHVVNVDFPLNMSDYIHRVGRVGRTSSPHHARVTHLVHGGLAVGLVQKLETAVRLGQSLPAVNNNIIRIIQNSARRKRGLPSLSR